MRSGIAEVHACAGKDVVVESAAIAVEAVRQRLMSSLKRAESLGKIESAEAVLANIRMIEARLLGRKSGRGFTY